MLIIGISWTPETFLARLIRGLAEVGLKITFALDKKPSEEWFSHPNLNWLFAPAWERFLLKRLVLLVMMLVPAFWQDFSQLCRLWRLARGSQGFRQRLRIWFKFLPFVGGKWDVVYFPWNSAAIEYASFFAGKCPIVLSCRGSQVNIAPYDPSRRDFAEGLRETFRQAAAVHCVSEAIKEEAMHYGLDPDKAWVIRPAVDPEFFHPAPGSSTKDNLSVISVGSLIWRKGYEYALQAIRLLVDQDLPIKYTIIGDGPERMRVLYTIDDLNLSAYVHLPGRLPPEKVRDYVQQADVFLLSSLSEGISNAALEAMACGLPVVTTDCGGMREAVTDGVEGLVVPVRDPAAMAAALARLAGDPQLRHRLGTAARERILQDFLLTQQVEEFKALFETVSPRIPL